MTTLVVAALLLGWPTPASATERTDDRAASEKAWERARSRWTRELKAYDGLTTALLLRATVESPDLIRAETDRWATLIAADPEAAKAREDAALTAAQTTWTVVFTATSEYEDLTFGTPEEAGAGHVGWGVRFYAGDRLCDGTATFERVAKPDAMRRALTPMTRWDTLWIARFSAASCGTEGPLRMAIAGPHGAGELRWSREDALPEARGDAR